MSTPFFQRLFLLGALMTSPHCSSDASASDWRSVATAASRLAPKQVDGATQRVDTLPEGARADVRAKLDELANTDRTIAGLRTADTTLTETAAALGSPQGPTPAEQAYRAAARAVLQGLVFQTGQAVANDHPTEAGDYLKVVRSLGGAGESAQPILVQEARQGLGPELYVKTLREERQ